MAAADHLNLSDENQSLATEVRVYQLKGAAKMTDVGLLDLLDDEAKALGPEKLAVELVTLMPAGRSEPLILPRAIEATHIAVVAVFRKPANAWKVIQKLPAPDPDHCHPGGKPIKGAPPPTFSINLYLQDYRVELR